MKQIIINEKTMKFYEKVVMIIIFILMLPLMLILSIVLLFEKK